MFALLSLTLFLGGGVEPKLSPTELAARIDEHILAKMKAAKVPPANPTSDAEFVRRVYLDLTGRVPDILSARDFIDNPAKDKRAALVRRLLADKRYSIHWANVWRSWLVADGSDQMFQFLGPQMEGFLREQLRENVSYDQLVTRMLLPSAGGTGAQVLYQSQQSRPENMASITTRMFLGVKLECAQCHDHPFAKWKKKQFWETAAFFSSNTATPMGAFINPGAQAVGKIKMPGNDKEITARFLDGKEPKISGDSRRALLDWMVARDNPFFARAAVNRLWEQMLGTGLVEPLDEESEDNPASHPELLTLLAKQFAANGYNLKYMLEAIVLSETYQRSSRQTHPEQTDYRLFARMRTRGLTPEQLFDSLNLVTGGDEDLDLTPGGFRPMVPASPRAEFLRRFPNQDRRGEQQTSILQALYLMNGDLVTDAVSVKKNKNLAIIANSTSVKTSRKVDQMFLIALNRKPTTAERERLVKYVDSGGPTKDPALALCDIFWALLNSSEFCSNH
jgi:hypothetical protein